MSDDSVIHLITEGKIHFCYDTENKCIKRISRGRLKEHVKQIWKTISLVWTIRSYRLKRKICFTIFKIIFKVTGEMCRSEKYIASPTRMFCLIG